MPWIEVKISAPLEEVDEEVDEECATAGTTGDTVPAAVAQEAPGDEEDEDVPLD